MIKAGALKPFAVAVSAAVLLAACGGAPEQSSPQPVQQSTAAPAPKATPKPAPRISPAPEKKVPEQQASLPPAPETPPEPVNDDPDQFLGMSSAQLSETVGRPGFVRRDKQVEVWQYHGEGCILDVFLYQDQGRLAVKYVDLRSQTLPGNRLRDCLADIIRAKSHTRSTS